MGRVYDEFVQELNGWRREYAGRPRQELIHLLLLALEREELVRVAYREDVILRRLAAMPISDEIRELVRSALVWVWKNEEMHTIYIRGALFKFGSRRLQAAAFGRQVVGAIGGWSASMRQHLRWDEAPISRLLATLTTALGSLAGRIPRPVCEHLDYRSFRDYCLFNIDAELTAWLSFKRLIELLESEPGLAPASPQAGRAEGRVEGWTESRAACLEDFRRIQADEARHRFIFEIFAAGFDEEDRLVEGETAESLAERIGAVGECFLPRARRTVAMANNALGGGGRVWVVQGTKISEKLSLFRRLLGENGLARLIQERASLLGKQVGELRVVIKPTFMFGYHHRDRSSLTDPELLKELARYLDAQGCRDLALVEGPNLYDRFYQRRTVHEVARYFEIDSPIAAVAGVVSTSPAAQRIRGNG